MDTPDRGRRAVLAGGASAAAALLAGCAGSRAGEETATVTRSDATDDERASDDDGTTRETTTTSTNGLVLPSLDVAGSSGGLVALRPEGKAVLLNFFATWCPPCDPEMENLRAVRERFDGSEVFVVSITQETDEAAIREFWDENRGNWPVVMDPSARAPRKYDVTSLPTTVALAPDGTEVQRHTGLVGEDGLVAAVEAAMAAGDSD